MNLCIKPGKISFLTRLLLTVKLGYKFFKSCRGWYLYPGDSVTSTFKVDVK